MESSKPQKPLTPRDKKNHTEKLKDENYDIDDKLLEVKAKSPLLRESKTMCVSVNHDLKNESFEPIKEESSIEKASVSQANLTDRKSV